MANTSQMSDAQIEKALEAGIITPRQAKAMREHLPKMGPKAQIGNEEDMRFLRSFSDVFIAIGLVLLGLGISGLVGLFGGGIWNWVAALGSVILAYYFGRKRRAHLPTLILALMFLIFVQAGADFLFVKDGILAALLTLVAMGLFYALIRLPFCIALIVIAGLYLVFALTRRISPDILTSATGIVLMICGAIIFAIALFYDSKDQHRTTRFSDNAFWLHFLAAPLIIHGLAIGAIQGKVEKLFGIVPIITINQGEAVAILIMVGIITLVGLAINRRALIVSSLGYAGFAIIFLIQGVGLGAGGIAVATLVMLGVAVVLLGTVWHEIRNPLIKYLPKWRVFPPPFEVDFKK
jgi:hypothetical protein